MNIMPFILTLIAGLSTLIGTILIFIKCDINKLTKYSLAFASGVMITVSLIDLIPESLTLLLKNNVKNNSFLYIIISILIGLSIAFIIDKLIKEEGSSNQKIYRLGIISMIAIIIHNIPEGIITYLTSEINITLGITITIAIALHNIPEGISISIPIYKATNSKKRAVGYTLISALAEPLGALLGFFFLKPIITNTLLGIILGIISGIMFYIGLFELLPLALKYKNKLPTILIFFLGSLTMIISTLLT